MTIIFLKQKYAALRLLQKYLKIKDLSYFIWRQFGCQLLSIQDLPFVLAQMNATSLHWWAEQMIVSYSGSGNLHAVGGVKGLMCKGWVISLRIEIECKDTTILRSVVGLRGIACLFLSIKAIT